MDIEIKSEIDPTHLSSLHEDGVLELTPSCRIPIQIATDLIEATENTPVSLYKGELSIFPLQSVHSKSSSECDLCEEEIETELLLDDPEALGDPTKLSCIIINDDRSNTNALIIHKECLEELTEELLSIIHDDTERLAAVIV